MPDAPQRPIATDRPAVDPPHAAGPAPLPHGHRAHL